MRAGTSTCAAIKVRKNTGALDGPRHGPSGHGMLFVVGLERGREEDTRFCTKVHGDREDAGRTILERRRVESGIYRTSCSIKTGSDSWQLPSDVKEFTSPPGYQPYRQVYSTSEMSSTGWMTAPPMVEAPGGSCGFVGGVRYSFPTTRTRLPSSAASSLASRVLSVCQ